MNIKKAVFALPEAKTKVQMKCKSSYPGHKLHENGEFPLLEVPQAPVVLDDPVVAQILQQLDLTLQSIDLLQREGRKR